jgi:hypothetical protein
MEHKKRRLIQGENTCGMDETEAARCGIFSRTGGEAP